MSNDRGIALIIVLIITTFLSALGIGLMMAVFMDRLASRNVAGSVAMLYAADAGIAIAARDLARAGEWDAALTGIVPSTFTDGAPGGIRGIPGGGTVNLSAATNMLNCGKAAGCSPAEMNANSPERPWGANNARWTLYAYGPMNQLVDLVRPAPCYLAVWIADDGREEDGDPSADAPDEGNPGHGIVRVHSEAFGVAGSRRIVEAELARICPVAGEGGCLPGIRVQSWQELRLAIP